MTLVLRICRLSSFVSRLLSFFIKQIYHPDETDEEHQRAERLSAAHAEEVDASEVCVRLAEKFDEKTEQTVSHQVKAGHLVVELWNLAEVVQNSKQDNSFE